MAASAAPALEKKLARSPGKIGILVFGVALVIGLVYTVVNLASDLATVRSSNVFPFHCLVSRYWSR